MQFLSKPDDFDYKKKKEYERFRFFNLALTERNWIGKEYITKVECNWFIEELKMLDGVFNNLFGDILSESYYTFLMDTSIFSGDLNSNINLLEFLEELEDFRDLNGASTEKIKMSKKHLKKLRNYASKPENYNYLFRWVFLNKDHIYSNQLLEILYESINNQGIRAKNTFMKEMLEVHKTLQKKSKKKEISAIELKKLEGELTNTVVHRAEFRDSDFFQKILKYGLAEPNLFFYSVYCIVEYFKHYEGIMAPGGHQFISLQKKKNGVEVFFKDSTEQLNELFLEHEIFLDTLPKEKRRATGTFQKYDSFYEINKDDSDLERERIDVLKSIAKWVKERIPEDATNILPNNRWVHYIKGDLLKEAGLQGITFESSNIIGGPNNNELLVKTIAYKETGIPILFPLFDPDSWENLNSVQCALITYGLCLYHDICIENNFELVPYQKFEETQKQIIANNMEDYADIFPYILYTKETVNKITPLKANTKNRSINSIEEENADGETKKRKEHWVSFHFRRVKTEASERQKEIAKQYGIKEIPKGFTFVSPHVTGTKDTKPNEVRVSALDVLNKTLNKLNKYFEEVETAQ